MLANFSPHF